MRQDLILKMYEDFVLKIQSIFLKVKAILV